jgi:hypothetical protein
VVVARLGRQAEIGGEEGAAEFGHEFFGGVAFVAPALAPEFAVEAGGVARPMGLMPISA